MSARIVFLIEDFFSEKKKTRMYKLKNMIIFPIFRRVSKDIAFDQQLYDLMNYYLTLSYVLEVPWPLCSPCANLRPCPSSIPPPPPPRKKPA